MKHLMVVIDTQDCPTPLLKTAYELAAGLQAEVVLVTVVAPAVMLPNASHPELHTVHVSPADDLQQAKQHLEHHAERFRGACAEVTCDVRAGDVVAGIMQAVEDYKPDLLVAGTHGRSGIGRLFMGSVAEQIIRKSKVPVVTVRCTGDGR